MSQYAPTPWKAVKKLRGGYGSMLGYVSVEPDYEAGNELDHLRMMDGSHHVCRMSHSHDGDVVAKHYETAQFIARAANAHADLVACLKAAVAMIEHSMDGLTHKEHGRFIKGVTNLQLTPDGSVTLDTARAALAKAEGIQ